MLLERDAELAAFDRALAAACDGQGGVLAFLSPYGGGRTALFDALDERCNDPRDLVVRATAVLDERAEDGALAMAVLDEVADAGIALAPITSDGAPPARAGRPDLASALADPTPLPVPGGAVVLLVDDLQWSDGPSPVALAELVDRVDGAGATPVLVVLACVDVDPANAGHELAGVLARVATPRVLNPLSACAVETLIRARRSETDGRTAAGSEPECAIEPSPEAEARRRLTGGLPLLVMADLAADRPGAGTDPVTDGPGTAPRAGADEHRAEAAAAGIRMWLADRYRAPLESLPADLLDVLTAVVVLDGNGDADRVGRLAGLGPAVCAVALGGLARLGPTDGADRSRPVHVGVADALEGLRGRRLHARWHLCAAGLAHRDGALDRYIADQLIAAGDHSAPWALETARRAAWAVNRTDGPEAGAYYLRAALMAIAIDSPDRGNLLLDLAELEREFDIHAALTHVLQALDLTETPRDRAMALARVGPLALSGSPSPLVSLVRRTVHELEVGRAEEDLAGRMRARDWYSGLAQPVRLHEMVEYLSGGSARFLDSAAGREQLAVLGYAGVLTLRVEAGEAAALAGAVLDREPPTADHVHSALPLVVSMLAVADRVRDVLSWVAAAAADAQARGHGVARCVMAGEQATVAAAAGDHAAARAHVRTVLATLGDRSLDAAPLVTFSVLRVAALVDEALAARMISQFRRSDFAPWLVALSAFVSGLAAARQADPRRAADHFRTVGDLLAQSGWLNPAVLPWRIELAGALVTAGDRDAALDVLAEQHVRAQEWGAPAVIGQVLRVRGTVLGGSAGRAMLEDAVHVLARSGNRRESGRASVALGVALHHEHDAAASAHLGNGLALAQACGDSATAAVAAAALEGRRPDPAVLGMDGSSVAYGSGQSRAPAGPALTRTELLVAQRVGAGLSNPEIARELEVGVRAVEKHLTRCYRKTGTRGRNELAELLATTNVDPNRPSPWDDALPRRVSQEVS